MTVDDRHAVSVCVLQRHSHCRNVKQFNVLVTTQLSGCISKFFCKADQTQIQIKLCREFSYPVPTHTGLKTVNYIELSLQWLYTQCLLKYTNDYPYLRETFYIFCLLQWILLSFHKLNNISAQKSQPAVVTAN